jgi:hypothetical protein
MDERQTRVSDLLHEAAETHHRVFRITDGADDDWASWYAQWLVTLSGSWSATSAQAESLA